MVVNVDHQLDRIWTHLVLSVRCYLAWVNWSVTILWASTAPAFVLPFSLADCTYSVSICVAILLSPLLCQTLSHIKPFLFWIELLRYFSSIRRKVTKQKPLQLNFRVIVVGALPCVEFQVHSWPWHWAYSFPDLQRVEACLTATLYFSLSLAIITMALYRHPRLWK